MLAPLKPPSLRPASDPDRARLPLDICVLRTYLAYGAEEQTGEAAVAARADDEQVRTRD